MPLFIDNLILDEANVKIFPIRNTKQIQQCYHMQNHCTESTFLYTSNKNMKIKFKNEYQPYKNPKE